ncbi:MAG: DNA-binding protein [Betaproteobacteria bacterium]|nr:MAG: DNA-binding protein [Betaproteobacteria bacterium]
MIDAVFPAPEPTELSAPYWRALDDGRLVFQRCTACQHAWLPARSECPRCLAPQPMWETASGRGRLVSWVVYHHAYHPYFASRLPYNVAVVELAEGPRLVTNIVKEARSLAIDMPVKLEIQREAGVALPRFAPA